MKIDTYWWGVKLTAENYTQWEHMKIMFSPTRLTIGETYEWWIDSKRDRAEQIAENIVLDEDEQSVTINR